MNELQIVLILLAIIIIVGLYFFHKRKEQVGQQNKDSMDRTIVDTNNVLQSNVENEQLEELEEIEAKVPDNQLGFIFDGSNEALEPKITLDIKSSTEEKPPKHIVIEDDDLHHIEEFEKEPSVVDGKKPPSFGIPKNDTNLATTDIDIDIDIDIDNVDSDNVDSDNVDSDNVDSDNVDSDNVDSDNVDSDNVDNSNDSKKVIKVRAQIFALIVMGSEEFLMSKINHTLHGVGLVLSDSGIFVKKDSMGNEIIRVANLLEPGVFSKDDLVNSKMSSAGIVLILELPTTVKAPAVMHDMILMARKISQSLNGRLYNMDRQLTKESDLQKMRDTAVAYETSSIDNYG